MAQIAREYEARLPELEDALPEPHAGMSVDALLASEDVSGAAEVLAGLDPSRDVLRRAATGPDPMPAAVAYRTLAYLGDDSLIADAAMVLAGPRFIPGLTRATQDYLRRLPGDAILAAARGWVEGGDDSALIHIGWWILAERATAEDVPRLVAAIEPALESDDMYRLCHALEGLGNVSSARALPVVERAFYEAPYSFARRYAAAVLAGTDPTFPTGLAVECLWDSDRDIRRIGAAAVDRTVPGVADRLAVLADTDGDG